MPSFPREDTESGRILLANFVKAGRVFIAWLTLLARHRWFARLRRECGPRVLCGPLGRDGGWAEKGLENAVAEFPFLALTLSPLLLRDARRREAVRLRLIQPVRCDFFFLMILFASISSSFPRWPETLDCNSSKLDSSFSICYWDLSGGFSFDFRI